MKTNNLLLSALALTIYSTSFGQYIPQDFAGEPAFPSHAYWQASGQILDTEKNVIQDLRYYTIGTGAKMFLFDDKISMVMYYDDSIALDTAWRLDLSFLCNGEGGGGESDIPEPCGTLNAHEITNGKLNYYLQHTGAGLENVDGYHRVIYENAWSGIDFHFYSNAIGLKTYIVVHPGADPNDILMQFTGQDQITTPFSGTLKMHLGSRNIKFPQAFAWQESSGVPTLLGWLPTWNNLGGGQISVTTQSYNTNEPLIIQIGGDIPSETEEAKPCPDGNWSTYVGDNMTDDAEDVVTDGTGDVYTTGSTNSAEYPVGSGQSTYNAQNYDVFVTKFRKSDRALIWSSFMGGTDNEFGKAIAHDGNGKVYAVGNSNSATAIPSPFTNNGNYIQSGHGNRDGLLMRLDEVNGDLQWITHFGGTGQDEINDIIVSGTDIYIAGYTESVGSSTCSVAGGGQMSMCDAGGSAYFQGSNAGFGDGFFARFDNTGSLTHSSFLGGSSSDEANTIGMDATGRLTIAGSSSSFGVPSSVSSPCGAPTGGDFPFCNPSGSSYYQDANARGFITQFNANLQLTWGTKFGGHLISEVTDLGFDSNNDLLVTGLNFTSLATTNTCNAPSTGSFPICASGTEYSETYTGGSGGSSRNNFYVARFNSSNELEWSTHYGEDSDIQINPSIALDDDDNIYVTSAVRNVPSNPSGVFPGQLLWGQYNQGGFADPTVFDIDAVIVAFNENNERMWATQFGGGSASVSGDHGRDDEGLAITVYNQEEMILTGLSVSTDLYQACPFPGTSYCQTALSNLTQDAFVTKFCINSVVMAIEEAKATEEKLNIFPNPSDGMLNILMPNGLEPNTLEIYSIQGNLVYQQPVKGSSQLVTVDIKNLNSGVYVVRLANSKEQYNVRFVRK